MNSPSYAMTPGAITPSSSRSLILPESGLPLIQATKPRFQADADFNYAK